MIILYQLFKAGLALATVLAIAEFLRYGFFQNFEN